MKATLILVLDKILSLVKTKQEHNKEKSENYSDIIGLAFLFLLIMCLIGYFLFPYSFNSDSWPVKFLTEILQYIKNS